MKTLLFLTLSGSALALLLLALRYILLKRMPSTVYYYAWLLVLLRFALPLPGFIPEWNAAQPEPVRAQERLTESAPAPEREVPAVEAQGQEEASVARADEAPGPVSDLPRQESQAQSAAQAAPVQSAAQTAPARSAARINLKDPAFWLWVWAAGTLVSLAVSVGAYLRFSRALRKTLRPPEKAVRRQYAEIPGKKPPIYVSRAARTPLTLGLLRPMIILPSGLGEGEVLANVLRHELMHVRRHDILYKWLALAVFSAHWFNPLTYVLRRELDQACELSCDEALLGSMTREEQRSYGDTLLQMAASRALPFGVVATTFATEKENLRERLRQILTYKKSATRVPAAVLAIVLLLACGVIAGPAAEAARPAGGQEPEPVEEPTSAPGSEEPEAAPEPAANVEPAEAPAASADEQYEAAAALFAAGDYERAIAAFAALDGYRDSAERIEDCRTAVLDEQYTAAISLFDDGRYDEAIAAFEALDGYRDSAEQIEACKAAISEEQYEAALALYADRRFAEAKAAFEALGDYKDSSIRARAILAIQQPISAGYKHTLAVRRDGGVEAAGSNYYGEMNVGDWTDIISVAAGTEHTLGLRSDGSVVACGADFFHNCDVSDWTDIVAVAAAFHQSVGLRADGSVVAHGQYVDGELREQGWTDILCISASPGHTVGLQSDGTAVALGMNNNGQCDVSDWTDLVAVAAGYGFSVGLRADGTAVAVGLNDKGQCNVSDWTELVAISAGEGFTLGLRADGSVVSVGANGLGERNVSDWTDIVAVSAGNAHSVGLRADGTAVATGENAQAAQASIRAYEVRTDGSVVGGDAYTYSVYDGRCDVSEWTDLRLPS